VGSAGDFDATGWGVSVSRNVAEGTRASLDYSRAGPEWSGRSQDFSALARVAGPGLRRSDGVPELTASLKVKRQAVAKKYAELVDAMYAR